MDEFIVTVNGGGETEVYLFSDFGAVSSFFSDRILGEAVYQLENGEDTAPVASALSILAGGFNEYQPQMIAIAMEYLGYHSVEIRRVPHIYDRRRAND